MGSTHAINSQGFILMHQFQWLRCEYASHFQGSLTQEKIHVKREVWEGSFQGSFQIPHRKVGVEEALPKL